MTSQTRQAALPAGSEPDAAASPAPVPAVPPANAGGTRLWVERIGKRRCMHRRNVRGDQPCAVEFAEDAHDAPGMVHVFHVNVLH